MANDSQCGPIEAYVLGALDRAEREEFEGHLGACLPCRESLRLREALVGRLAATAAAVFPSPPLREETLDLAAAPMPPIDLSAYDWEEVSPGVKVHVLREDPARNMRGCLVWARAGARHPVHRHLGAENILVLQGLIRDHRAAYGPGQVCRSRAGSVHAEEALPEQDCVCYVVYYGDLEFVAE